MPQLGDVAPYAGPDTPLLLLGRAAGPNGDHGRPTPDAALPRDPWDTSLWLEGQGRANACGTTTLAYVLRYLLGDTAPDRFQIDRSLRRADIFSAPDLLAAYPRRLGLPATTYNGVDTDFVLSLTDRGIPVMVLLDTTPLDLTDTANLHWVCVVAHDGDSIAIYNPHGFQQALDRASFESHWGEARLFGLPAWRNFAIAIASSGTVLPPAERSDVSAFGANLAATGVAGVVNGATTLRQQFTSGGVGQKVLAALPGVLGLAVPAAQTVAGAALLLGSSLFKRRWA